MTKNSMRNFPQTRLRRTRQNNAIRSLVSETQLNRQDLILPVFATSDSSSTAIPSMPGVERLSPDDLLRVAEEALNLGVTTIALFPVIKEGKSPQAEEAYNPEGLAPQSIRNLHERFPELIIIADVALDPYTSHGQDGIIDDTGYILNDTTNQVLRQQARVLGEAGAQIVAPSDMMDGRVGEIRQELDDHNLQNTLILSYAAKYASQFYGPFRDAIGSSSNLAGKGKHTYQMDPANSNEAIQEVALDLQEGADIVMIKPGMPYLDIIEKIKSTFQVPTFAYQVSGEYSMLKLAIRENIISQDCLLESLVCLKRAGADAILTYAALDIASKLAPTT